MRAFEPERIGALIEGRRDEAEHYGLADRATRTFHVVHAKACADGSGCPVGRALAHGVNWDLFPDHAVVVMVVENHLVPKPLQEEPR